MNLNIVQIHVDKFYNDETTNSGQWIGGTSTYIHGFRRYLQDRKNLVHCRQVPPSLNNLQINLFTIYAKSTFELIYKLIIHLLINPFKGDKCLYYCHRPDHLALTLIFNGIHVIHLHGQPYTTINNSRNKSRRILYNLLERFSIRHTDHVIATDKMTANLYSTLYPKLKANISIIPTGVNFQNYNSKTKSCSFSDILPGTFNFAFVGRLTYPKQVKTIINAFNQAFFNRKSVHLWIAGSGRDDEQLKDYVITLECVENIHFTGQLSRENTEKLMKSADAGVLLSENEGSPIVVKEFLAYAKPVIVNNVGDITDYVKDGINGYIVDPKNLQSITNALHKIMLTNKRMSVAAIESVIPYEERNIYKKVIDVFQKLNEQH